ncbi:MAG: right-handed parallel beta-helix repeat-containing protein [Phycisphaerae bacterium]|nr:right-handed parallel beta-helix repeat-containing protein [Phycisphaerae bacterium]
MRDTTVAVFVVTSLILRCGAAQAVDRHVPGQYATIQAAIDASVDGDEVLIADGIYMGPGNRDLDFAGRAIVVRSAGGDAEACILDCEYAGRGFHFHSGEGTASVVADLTIRNGEGNYGGAIYCEANSAPTIVGCILCGNTGSNGGAVTCRYSNPTLEGCVIRDNVGAASNSNGGGIYCMYSSPVIRDCLIRDNRAIEKGGGMYCEDGNPVLEDCVISGNVITASNSSGGGLYLNRSDPVLRRCTITGNAAYGFTSGRGGGIYCSGSSPDLTNCVIAMNTAERGGGIHCWYSSHPNLVHCTLAANVAWEGAACSLRASSPANSLTLGNCIVWNGNVPIVSDGDSLVSVTHSNVSGGWAGTGNIDTDPRFAFDDDFHLTSISPCIDAGTNLPPGGLPADDLDGNARALDGDGDGEAVADMGALEFDPARPSIAVSDQTIDLAVLVGHALPDSPVLSVRNAGGGTLEWSIEASCGWLTPMPSSGESVGEPDEITLDTDTAGLAPGQYACVLTVSDPLASNDHRTINVALVVYQRLDVPAQYPTIQAAIDAALDGDEIVIADGLYRGPGNRDLDFLGKGITVRSAGGDPSRCVIDCEMRGRGFYFHTGEESDSVVEGITVMGGRELRGGAVYCEGGSPTLRRCVFRQNESVFGGGAMHFSGSRAFVSGCAIHGNRSTLSGGGMNCSQYSTIRLHNTEIRNNAAATQGGGADVSQSALILSSCTIAGNSANQGRAVAFAGTSQATAARLSATNCILWNGGDEMFAGTYSSSVIGYSDVSGGWTGEGNIDADPMFAFDQDLHLLSGSPCIDAGTNGAAVDASAFDLDGNERVLDGNGDALAVVDMGAYEHDPDSATIGLSTQSITLSAPLGGSASGLQAVSIRNAGTGFLEWTVDSSCDWLRADPLQGESTGEVDDVALIVDASQLSHGRHNCELVVSAPAATNPSRTVYVEIVVYQSCQVPGEYGTIQEAIDAAVDGDEVILADGVYTGSGNRDLDFLGKAITVRGASGDPTACVIDCQYGGRGFLFVTGEGRDSRVADLTILHGQESGGGAIYCMYGSGPTISHCVLKDNVANGGDGAALCCEYHCNPVLQRCVVEGNRARGQYGHGGAFYCGESCNPCFDRCTIRDNAAVSLGGALYSWKTKVLFTNCILDENTCPYDGGAVYAAGSNVITLVHCTLTRNSAARGHAFACYSGSTPEPSAVMMTNCIVWDGGDEIYNDDGSSFDVTYSDFRGGWPGVGNIDVDPAFAFADDVRLTAISPCIDAGTNTPVTGPVPEDVDGNPRPLDGDGNRPALSDMGAFEYNPGVPSIALSAEHFGLAGQAGGGALPAQTLSIRNAGGGELVWSVLSECDWLTVTPQTGESAGEVEDVDLHVDIGALSHGHYSCLLTVSDQAAVNDPRWVRVELDVYDTLLVPSQYGTIQSALDDAVDGDVIVLADGTYSGPGNRDIDFLGKTVTLRSAADDPTLCVIDCQSAGRAFLFDHGETPETLVTGVTVTNGFAHKGGGAYCSHGSSPSFVNCRFIANRVSGYGSAGGALYCLFDSSPRFTDCVLDGNNALGTSCSAGAVSCDTRSNAEFTQCTISGNTATGSSCTGGAIVQRTSGLTLTDCTITGNVANGAGSRGGAIFGMTAEETRLTGCLIANNFAGFAGGAIAAMIQKTLSLTNCVLRGNTAVESTSYGGAVFSFSCQDLNLNNCTLSANAAYRGRAVACYSGITPSTVRVSNSVLWNGGSELYQNDGSVFTVAYSDVFGGYVGVGNIAADPLFVDPAVGDYRLLSGSPCIDAGDNEAVPPGVMVDLAGRARFVDDPATPDTGNPGAPGPPIVDIGAYEYAPAPTADLDGDGDVDVDDYLILEGCLAGPDANAPAGCEVADLDGDADVDLADFGVFSCAFGRD